MTVDTESIIRSRVFIPSTDSKRTVVFNYISIERYLDQFDKIEKIYPNCRFVISAYNDPYNYVSILDRLKSLGLTNKIWLLVGDKEFATANASYQVRFFSFFWHWLHLFYKKNNNNNDKLEFQRNTKVSCLNRMPNFLKLITYYELQSKTWFPEVFSSFGVVEESNNHFSKLDSDVKHWFIENKNLFPYSKEAGYKFDTSWQQDDEIGSSWSHRNSAYQDAFANVVTETVCQTLMLTEKTIKPIVAGNLIFMSAAPGALSLLKDLKFDVDYQGINTEYDRIDSHRDRIVAMVNEIDLVYNNLPDIWHQNKDRIEYNRHWAIDDNGLRRLLWAEVSDLFED